MRHLDVNLTIRFYWQFKEHPHLKVTKCLKIINCKNGNILKHTRRGYFIVDRYIKRKELNSYIEKVKSVSLNQFESFY